jgi:exonuclease SbcC
MRIEKLKIENINSLKGTWEIDFTDPAYGSGIFSITGPTGAGKSTVLDALCLSLFGKTPRLGKITTSGNEAMNRESSSCQAECTFLVAGGRYRTNWSQRRARKEAKGRLQDVQHAIYKENAAGGFDCLEGGKNNTQKKIEEVLGLDFDQFTRSVLLAQGNFASLLKAEESEKSQILEDITGTGIYSVIGQKVFERCKSERIRTEELQKKVDDSPALKPEDRALLEEEQRKAAEKEKLLTQEEKNTRTAFNWRTSLDKLIAEKDRNQEKRRQHEADRPKFEELKTAIADCERAETIEPAYTALENLSDQVRQLTQSNEKLQQDLSELSKNCRAAFTARTDAENAQKNADRKAAALRPTLITVRALDAQIKTHRPNLESQKLSLTELQKSIQDQDADLLKKRGELSEKKDAKCKLDEWFSEHPGILKLDVQKQALEMRSEDHRNYSRDLLTITSKQLPECQKEIREKSSQIKTFTDRLNALKEAEGKQKIQKDALEKASAELFGDASKITAESRALSDKKHAAAELEKALNELLNKDKSAVSLEERIRTKERNRKEKIKDLENLKNKKEDKENLLGKLKKIELIQKYEADRATLQDGEPCPLCGATEHPYCREMPESMRALTEQIDETSAEINNLEGQYKNLDKEIAKTDTEIDLNRKQLSEVRTEASDITATLRRRIPENIDADNREAVKQYLQKTEQEYAQETGALNKKIELINEQNEKIRKINESLDKTAEQIRRAENGISDEKVRLGELKTREQQLHELQAEKQAEIAKVEQYVLDTFGLLLSDKEKADIPLAFRELQKKYLELLDKKDKLSHLEKDIPLLEEKITGLTESIENDSDRKNKLAAQKDDLEKKLSDLEKQRFRLFADRDPDSEEKQAETEALDAKQKAEEAVRKHTALTNSESKIKGQLETLKEQLTNALSQHKESEKDWEQALKGASFADIETWKKALGLRARKAECRTAADNFSTAGRIIEEDEKRIQKQIADAQLQKPTELTAKELEQQANGIAENRRTNQELLGGLREKIERDNQNRKELDAVCQELESQKQIYAEWKSLDDLIGSADGRKYRTIVQRITFKALLQYANSALKNLSPRYRLTAEKTGLNVSVTDMDLGGETRPSSNLSGGETFLVSLALALGLSRMASRKVRISSLFLDEGFGTLDERSLEDALNALSLMNQPGNLIGVISHVGKIHERIPVGIRVTPSGTGNSTLTGNGVHRA